MKKQLILASIMATSIGFTAPSFGAIIDNVTYTTDTQSGLDWLDVTATMDSSYETINDEFGTSGDYNGYRYATTAEFNTLITNYLVLGAAITETGSVFHEEDSLDALIAMLGDTHNTFLSKNNSASEFRYTLGILGDSRADGLQRVAIVHATDDPTNDDLEFTRAWFDVIAQEDSTGATGSYLVRDTAVSAVPIPAAAFMFAPALLGFLGFRRKVRA